MAAAIWLQKDMRSPSGGEARHRGGTQVGKAPPSPEMTISGLTESGLSGRIILPKLIHSPALPDVRPAPQAGCFVSGLKLSKDSAQITLRHQAFRTVAIVSSSALWNGHYENLLGIRSSSGGEVRHSAWRFQVSRSSRNSRLVHASLRIRFTVKGIRCGHCE